MPKRAVVECIEGQWVQLTDALVSSAIFQNQSGATVRFAATPDATAPTGEIGLAYPAGTGEDTGTPLAQIFPTTVTTSGHVWALGQTGASIFIEHL